jgi:hypothetical protein
MIIWFTNFDYNGIPHSNSETLSDILDPSDFCVDGPDGYSDIYVGF